MICAKREREGERELNDSLLKWNHCQRLSRNWRSKPYISKKTPQQQCVIGGLGWRINERAVLAGFSCLKKVETLWNDYFLCGGNLKKKSAIYYICMADGGKF